jgi:aryl carrier-like protein
MNLIRYGSGKGMLTLFSIRKMDLLGKFRRRGRERGQ